jgi:hypothetical protein
MAAVPGRKLEDVQSRGSTHVQEVAAAFAAGMQVLWSAGLKHGDLGLRNVLFDFERRTIAMVDPGTAESCPVCHRAGRSAIALDLGHLIAELTTDVNDLVGGSSGRASKQDFVTAVLRHALQSAGPERLPLLADIRASVTDHLADALVAAVTPRGIWNRLVRSVAERRVADLLGSMEREIAAPPSKTA